MRSAEEFVHVLLFKCPVCHGPSAAFCLIQESNLETADDHVFPCHCDCGWAGELVGFLAIRHWVAPWDAPLASKAAVAGTAKSSEAA